VLRDVLDDREGGDDAKRLARRRSPSDAGQGGADQRCTEGAEPPAARKTKPHCILPDESFATSGEAVGSAYANYLQEA
jgi:hypothetical protein